MRDIVGEGIFLVSDYIVVFACKVAVCICTDAGFQPFIVRVFSDDPSLSVVVVLLVLVLLIPLAESPEKSGALMYTCRLYPRSMTMSMFW